MIHMTHKRRKPDHGYILMEFMVGLSLIMFMLILVITMLGKARQADVIMSLRRQAIYKVESQFATMQLPGQAIKLSQDMAIDVLDEKPSDDRYAWVKLTAKHDGQQASLVGLICREYVGAQP